MAEDTQKEADLLWILGFLALALALIAVFGQFHKRLGLYLATLNVLAWTLPAYIYSRHRRRDPLIEYGLLVKVEPKAWIDFSVFVVLGLPLYLLLTHHYVTPLKSPLPGFAEWSSQLIHHLCFVALAEEFYFRGALQPALKRIFNKWLALILTAMLFALAHVVVDGQPMRLLVFFPGLLFGWLKHRSTSIVPGILFHALCNLIYIALPVMNHR